MAAPARHQPAGNEIPVTVVPSRRGSSVREGAAAAATEENRAPLPNFSPPPREKEQVGSSACSTAEPVRAAKSCFFAASQAAMHGTGDLTDEVRNFVDWKAAQIAEVAKKVGFAMEEGEEVAVKAENLRIIPFFQTI